MPFLDIITNLVLFLLATSASVMVVSEVRADLPSFGPGRAPLLRLSVTLTEQGIVMATAISHIGPDCTETTRPAVTAARTRDGYDFGALAICARRMHDAFPIETGVVLTADPSIPYRDFVGAMDALRSDGDVVMFPDVHVSAGLR